MAISQPITLEQARAAKPLAAMAFAPLATVVGLGITRIGTGYGIKVNLQSQPSGKTTLPTEIDGVPVQVEVTGQPRKQGPH
ncbi:hypothetical protein [Zavarzinella formosa]|uniref:hypothetical protein n=1 Tax=Zavarzinella formosa TaxID=360055 RepID=UPI0002FA22D1|nr:hypothetical protein [Zavarzinella formosa]